MLHLSFEVFLQGSKKFGALFFWADFFLFPSSARGDVAYISPGLMLRAAPEVFISFLDSGDKKIAVAVAHEKTQSRIVLVKCFCMDQCVWSTALKNKNLSARHLRFLFLT